MIKLRICTLFLTGMMLSTAMTAYGQDAPVAVDEAAIAAEVLGSEASLKKQNIKSKYKTYDELGVENEVLAAWKNNDGFVIETLIHYGTEYYEDPTMQVFVGIDKEGAITNVAIGETVDHTPAYYETVTSDYLSESYQGQTASYSFIADAVAGATYSSDTVLYGVRLASWYAANVFRVGERESKDVQLKQLESAVPGTYEKLELDSEFSCEAGSVKYVAQGTSAEGEALSIVVTEAVFIPEDENNNMAMPVFQVWFREADHSVCLARMQSGRFYEGFAMDETKLENYYGVEIVTGDEFDDFTAGLITDAEEYILTSATLDIPEIVTGATPQGNDTSLAVRNCLITAAKYYASVLLAK